VRDPFAPPRRPKQPGESQEIRSQAALELVLNLYAVAGALIVFRSFLRALRVDRSLWVGEAIYGVTNPFVVPFTLLPAAETRLIGDLTLADLTLLALVILFPIGISIYGGRGRK
jgi:uncharacterized protein YggT (Ycf19 family)